MLNLTGQIIRPWRRTAPGAGGATHGRAAGGLHGGPRGAAERQAGEELFRRYLERQTGSDSAAKPNGLSLTDMLGGKETGGSGLTGASMGHLPGLEDRRHLAGMKSGGVAQGHGFGRAAHGHLGKALRAGMAVEDSKRTAKLSGTQKMSAQERHEELKKQAEKWVGQTFYGQMLKEMRNSPFKSKIFDGGRGGEAFSSLYDQHLIDRMSRGAGGKLVDSLVRRIEGKSAARSQIAHGTRQAAALGLPPAANGPMNARYYAHTHIPRHMPESSHVTPDSGA